MAKTISAQQTEFIRETVERLVRRTGFPVTSQVLTGSGIATREELRKLEKKGILKSCLVTAGRGILNAYYTEGAVPDVVKQKQAQLAEQQQEQPSEVRNPEGSEVPA